MLQVGVLKGCHINLHYHKHSVKIQTKKIQFNNISIKLLLLKGQAVDSSAEY